ncbi:ArsR/SmtB family transcription factor [Phytohabitans sp. LJ34]|uniref:ArsR/SmtB family transcription factor n=1 Tax=Phytohabitans sp. LJ34 TaxID=3452217 RepID=UPI003F8AD1A3
MIRLLADPLRARIVEILAAGAACTCHLVADTGATQPNVSNHLRALRQAGIVEARPEGRYTFYRLRAEALDGAAGYLSALAEQARDSGDVRREC